MRAIAAAALLCCCCRAPAPGDRSLSVMLSLEADPEVTRAEVVGDLVRAPRAMQRRGSGWQAVISGLARGRAYRYRFRVFRADLGRWIVIPDPRAWQLDASRERWSVLFAGPPPPRPRAHRPPPLRDLVIYELCPREIVDRATPHARPAGRASQPLLGRVFRRITERIRSGYFERLGVNALELMPVLAQGWVARPGPDGRRRLERPPWGYQALSWYAINGDYGSARDLAALVDAAHERGLSVIVDYSLDHGYGARHNPLLTDLRPSWRNPRPTNRWGLLELRLNDPAARRFLLGSLRRLLVDLGFDGVRFDWTEKIDVETWSYFVKEIRRFKPGALLISENPRRELVARAGFDGVWDFFFQWEAPLLLRGVYRNYDGFKRELVDTQRKLVENLTARAFPPDGARAVEGLDASKGPPVVRYVESHDLPRIARRRVRWQHGGDQLLDVDGDGKTPDWLEGGSARKSRLAATLLATVPGAIMIFQGQEFGAADDLVWGFDPLRWERFDRPTFSHYRRALRLRRDHAALRGNDLRLLLDDSKRHLLAFSRGVDPRRADDDSIVVIFNFGSAASGPIDLQLPARARWRRAEGGREEVASQIRVDLPASEAAVFIKVGTEGSPVRSKPHL